MIFNLILIFHGWIVRGLLIKIDHSKIKLGENFGLIELKTKIFINV